MFGHRAIYHDGWRAVCPWPGPSFTEAAQKGRHYGSPIDGTVLADIEANDWELYDLTTDYAETNNVAAEHRDKVIEMIGRWWAEAGKYSVMPIDGSMLERLRVERPTIAKPRDQFVYYPGGSPVPFSAAPKVYNRAFSITADVQIPEAGAEGVLIAHGGRVGGYSFFVKDSQLHFVYNFLGRDFFTVISDMKCPLATSRSATSSNPPASPTSPRGRAYRRTASSTSTGSWSEPSTCPTPCRTSSAPRASPAVTTVAAASRRMHYQDDFAFTGTLKRVTIDLSGDLIVDTDTDMKVAMARQ